MFKKSLLVASIVGAGAVVSGIALADTGMSSTYCKPGFYAGLEVGRGDTTYNQSQVLSQVVNSYAGGAGYVVTPGSFRTQTIGTAGRLYAGYQFNPYFALEAGYTQFNKTSFGGAFSGTGAYSYSYRGEVTEHATDTVAKLTMPFQYGFGAYLKGGAAFIAADRHINQNYIANSNGVALPQNTFYTKSYQAIRPTYGVGLDYTIPNTSVDVDVSYTEIASGGGIPKASLAALGLTAKFA